MSPRTSVLAVAALLALPVSADAAKLKGPRFEEGSDVCLRIGKLTNFDHVFETGLRREERPFGGLTSSHTFRVTVRGEYEYVEKSLSPGQVYRTEGMFVKRFALEGRGSAKADKHPAKAGPLRSDTEVRLYSSESNPNFSFGLPPSVSFSPTTDEHTTLLTSHGQRGTGLNVGSMIGSGTNAINGAAGDDVGLERISVRTGASAGKGGVNPHWTTPVELAVREVYESYRPNRTVKHLRACNPETNFDGPAR